MLSLKVKNNFVRGNNALNFNMMNRVRGWKLSMTKFNSKFPWMVHGTVHGQDTAISVDSGPSCTARRMALTMSVSPIHYYSFAVFLFRFSTPFHITDLTTSYTITLVLLINVQHLNLRVTVMNLMGLNLR